MVLTLTLSSGRYALAAGTLLCDCGGVEGPVCGQTHTVTRGMATVHWMSCFLEAWAP